MWAFAMASLRFYFRGARHETFQANAPEFTLLLLIGIVLLINAECLAVTAPSAVSVTPNSGSGVSQTFSFLYSDAEGYNDLSVVQTVINSSLDYAGSCSTYYFPGANTLELVQDSGSGYVGSGVLGTAGTLENSQCSINLGASTATGTGTNLTVNLAITFKATFTGPKTI